MEYTKDEQAALERLATATYTAGEPRECTVLEALDALSDSIVADWRRRDAAWARLVKATETMARTDNYDPRDEYSGAVCAAHEARQALRDLGVDVNALLGDT